MNLPGLADVQAEVARRKLELADESAAFMASVEEKMGDIVMKALRKCVDEIGDRELVVQVVRKVMKAVVRNQRQITLRVAPDMVETVRSRMSDILADFPLLDEVDFRFDSRAGSRRRRKAHRVRSGAFTDRRRNRGRIHRHATCRR